jgi:hypothetical protein
MPASANAIVALPSAPVTPPPTLAPSTGEPSWPSVTVTSNGWPVMAVSGALSRSTCCLEKASNAQSTSSPEETISWHPPACDGCEFTYWPQNWVSVAGSGPTRSIRKSWKPSNQVPSQV